MSGCAANQPAPAPAAALLPAAEPSPGANRSLAPPPTAAGDLEHPADSLTEVKVTYEPWTFEGAAGQLIITPHYGVHTTVARAARPMILDRLPLFLERALLHYTTALAALPMPDRPLETYLFGTRSEWEAKTKQILPDQASTYLNLGRGGYTTRGIAVLYDIGGRDTLAIAAHEGWHQYSQSTFASPLPAWLEEGVATYMEGHIGRQGPARFRPWANTERYDALRQAARAGKLIRLNELIERTPQSFLSRNRDDLLCYYAQVWALTHFLVEGEGGKYAGSLKEILQDAVSGRLAAHGRGVVSTSRGQALVAEYFNRDSAQFQAEYERFVEAIATAPGGWERIVSGSSPLPSE